MKRLSAFWVLTVLLSMVAFASDVTSTPSRIVDEGSGTTESSRGRPKAVSDTGLHFVGNVSYQFAGSLADLKADQVRNSRATGVSGTLRMVLWASAAAPVFGQTITAYTLATYQLGQLAAGQSLYSIDSGSVAFSAPPDGTWYMTMALQEYDSSTATWYYEDLSVFQNTQTWPRPSCSVTGTNLCLSGGRFSVSVNWQVPSQNQSGAGTAVPVTSDTGYFWFFSSSNIELVVKVLDARGVNGSFWVFYGALSNVKYTITVKDTQTGTIKTYTNPSGQMASVADTTAFPDAGGPPAQTVNVSGTWDGTSYINGVTAGTFTMTLVQNGTNVSGTFAAIGGGNANVTGTVNGQAFEFQATQLSPCLGSASGGGTVNTSSTQMNGSYSGADCNGSYSYSFTAIKR